MGRRWIMHPGVRAKGFEDRPLHPLTRELMNILPPPGSTWPRHKQEAFVKAAEAIFDLLYEDDAPMSGEGE